MGAADEASLDDGKVSGSGSGCDGGGDGDLESTGVAEAARLSVGVTVFSTPRALTLE